MDVVLGVTGISAVGGFVVRSSTEMSFCETKQVCGGASREPLMVDEQDYRAQIDAIRRTCMMT